MSSSEQPKEGPGGLQAALPRELYVDPDSWRRERDLVLFGEWFCVGRLDDLGLSDPGRVAVVDVVGESVVLTSDDGGALHAAYNVCRHRGSQLFPLQPGAGTICEAAGAIRCPYHSWTYGLDGRLLKAPHTELTDDERATFSLHEVGVEAREGYVFVHLGDPRPVELDRAWSLDDAGRCAVRPARELPDG